MCSIWLGLIYPDYSVGCIVITEQLQSCEFSLSIEPREQCIRVESHTWSFACPSELRQKLFDDIKVYG